MIFQTIGRRGVGFALINISPLTFFLLMLLPSKFHQNYQGLMANVSIHGTGIVDSEFSQLS